MRGFIREKKAALTFRGVFNFPVGGTPVAGSTGGCPHPPVQFEIPPPPGDSLIYYLIL